MFQIKIGKFWKKRWQVWIQMLWKQYWDIYVLSKWPSLFCKFFKNLSPFLCHFVTENREYNKWLCGLKHHIQVSRLPVQGPWLGLIHLARWWRCPLPSGPSLTLPHRNSCIETHFVLLAKIIEYSVFQSLSLLCTHWSCADILG